MAGKLSFLEVGQAKCTDDLTLDLRFKAPNATSLVAFTDRAAWIFNKAWFEAGGEQAMFTDLSVGTGPFVWAEGQEVVVDEQRFEKNPNYFKGDGALPYLDEVLIFGIVDESAQQAAMLAHQGNWHWVRNFGQYNAYVNHDQIMTVMAPPKATTQSGSTIANLPSIMSGCARLSTCPSTGKLLSRCFCRVMGLWDS
jgi:ABC-type transport system substrate-binding protein